ncbi:MAG TPA: cytochrome c oxidase assembly factor Coa1 family protein [Pyrinomonadaceae bacterium]|jgi:TonB family protein
MQNPNQAQFGGSFQQPPAAQRPKGCLGRNWKWMLPVGCLGLILGVVALVCGIFFFAMSAIKSSDVYQGAVKAAQAHPAAVERLGEPVKDGWFVKGNIKVDAGGGSADFEVPLSGPKKSGTLFVRAVNPDGTWMYERLDLAVEGGETVSLLDRNVVHPPPGTPVDVEEDADDALAEPEEGEPSESPSPSDGEAVSGGLLDGKAVSKPEPPYPAIAKAARASGKVTVRVTVDETGHVVSAEPVSGHPLLHAAAVAAAKQARFAPTLQGGEPVKVSGVLTYNFVLEQ